VSEETDRQLPPVLETFRADLGRVMQRADEEQLGRLRWASRRGRFTRQRGRGWGWRPLGVVVLLVLSATAAAATIPLLGGSQRLTGAVPPSALTSPAGLPGTGATLGTPAGLRYAIAVIPDLEPGDTGWCAQLQFTLPRARTRLIGGGQACAPADAHAMSIVSGGGELSNVLSSLHGSHRASGKPGSVNPLSPQQVTRHAAWINWFVVSDQVAQVRIGSARYAPRPDPELAPGWRAVVIFTRGLLGAFELIGHHGQLINQDAPATAPTVSVTTVNPHHLPPAVCSLAAIDLPGVAGQWEVIADHAPRRAALVPPDALFSCARAWYASPSQNAVYSAAILLNAQDPAQTAPDLPGLTPTAVRGDFEEAAAADGQITAKRVGTAWLVVQGPDQHQRAALLKHITAAGSALRHNAHPGPANG
jgi:hypothetical protein